MSMLRAFVFIVTVAGALGCTSDLNCSLNGICTGGSCVCDKPWKGDECGILGYKVTPAKGKDLYPVSNLNNTWNGPIVPTSDGKFHFFCPLYPQGHLYGPYYVMHGVADAVDGPYDWNKYAPIPGNINPAFLIFERNGKKTFSLWNAGKVLGSDSIDGPFVEIGKFSGGNPAPIFYNDTFFLVTQGTTEVLYTKSLQDSWQKFADINFSLPSGQHHEDPYMWIDKRNNWHIINHAYDTNEYNHCGSSLVSAHHFSPNGIDWYMLPSKVNPYGHTVHFDDNTSHTYTTLERPNLVFDSNKQMTHINLAADLITGDEGCAARDKCPAKHPYCACTNCKYGDHAGSLLIALDV